MEEKKYSIVGEVRIGTDEYRDLIESAAMASKDADNYRSKFWAEESKNRKLEEKVAVLEKFAEFVNSSDEIRTKYKLFLLEKDVTCEE
jgi:hypothetical protein